jgi:hypothetical protein
MENWKAIKGYEGIYEVSDHGNVRSVDRTVNDNGGPRFVFGVNLKGERNKQGYLRFTLCEGSGKRKFFAHQLVALNFINNPEGHKCVNHKDCDKANNRLENLEWCNHKQNSQHAANNGLMKGNSSRLGMTNEKHAKSRPVMQISLTGELIETFPSLQEVNRVYGFHHANVGACARGNLKTAYGYKWQYQPQ